MNITIHINDTIGTVNNSSATHPFSSKHLFTGHLISYMRIRHKLWPTLPLISLTLFLFGICFKYLCFEKCLPANPTRDRCGHRWLLGEERLPVIYVITPTYSRLVQKAELIRLSHTLLLVKNVHWIVVEDAQQKTSLVKTFLEEVHTVSCGALTVTHLNAITPSPFKMKSTDPNWLKPRGVLQRNAGINWIRDNRDSVDDRGVVYFADDDNTYDLKLFAEMRDTRLVSVWPVGLVGGLTVEKPIVQKGKVVGWNTMWKKERPFPIDMSGFAVSAKLLFEKTNALFSLKVSRGYQESYFIKQLIDGIDQLEPKANHCTQILVFHTRTERPDLKQERKLKTPSNHGIDL